MQHEYIALGGVIFSGVVSLGVAWVTSQIGAKNQKIALQETLSVERDKFAFGVRSTQIANKIDISYKYVQMARESPEAANLFLQEIAKQTAIGFLYQEDSHDRAKIWIRDDSNILIGRHFDCDIILADEYVSRQHAMLHSADSKVFLCSLKPTNDTRVNEKKIYERTELKNGDHVTLGQTTMTYFNLV